MAKFRLTVRKYRQALITLLAVIILVAVAFFFLRNRSQPSTDQLSSVTNKVGELMFLPSGETPTLATVTDVSKLKGQAIFSNAQNGDKVLVYVKAQKIIVFRPSADKLVDVEPLVSDKKGSPYVTSSIAILNGSGNSDLLAKMTRAVVSAFPNSTIVLKDTAPRTFPNSIAIDLTKKNQPLDEQIADTLGIKAGQLPLGIGAPNSDFLIIIGQDYK